MESKYSILFGFVTGEETLAMLCSTGTPAPGRCGKKRNFTIFLNFVADFRYHLAVYQQYV